MIGTVVPFSATPGTAQNSAVTFNLPSGLANGDLGIVLIGTNSGTATISTPTGWTVLQAEIAIPTFGNQRIAIFAKSLTAAESGAAVSSTLSASGRWCVAGLVIPGATMPTAGSGIYWHGASETSTSISATGTTGTAGGLLVALGYKRIPTAGADPNWSPAGMTERIDIATTNGTGVRFGAWAGDIAATGSAQGPYTLTLGSAGNGSGYTFAIAAALEPEAPQVWHFAEVGGAITPCTPFVWNGTDYDEIAEPVL